MLKIKKTLTNKLAYFITCLYLLSYCKTVH